MKKKVKKKKRGKSIRQLKIEIQTLRGKLIIAEDIAKGHSGQLGMLVRDNRKYKHEILMMQVEIQYLKTDRDTYLREMREKQKSST